MNKKTTVEAQVTEAIAQVSDFAKDQAASVDAANTVYKTGFADLQTKALTLTQTNLDASFAFTKAAFGLKDVSAFFALQNDFVKAQTTAFQNQAKELNEMTLAVAKDAVKPVQDGFAKSIAQFNKAIAA